MSDAPTFALSLEQRERFLFDVTFDGPGWPVLRLDEPQPLGDGSAPNASRLLGAAVGNCLAASLLFCATRKGASLGSVHADVTVEIFRNENKRLRVGRITVVLDPEIDPATLEKARECLGLFEDFCTVTASIRQGIPVEVKVNGLET